MAISKDTAALVAAQLTQAWAIHSAGQKFGDDTSAEERVLSAYLKFKELVAEVDIRKPTYDMGKVL